MARILIVEDNPANLRLAVTILTHAALLKAAFGPLGEELERQIEDFLYPEALQTLQRARQEHPKDRT